MRPIQQRTDQAFSEALKAVEFRFPTKSSLAPPSMELALGLRYGLMGAAATHDLLLSCPNQEEPALLSNLRNFGCLVEAHVKSVAHGRVAGADDPAFAGHVGRLARESLLSYLPYYRRICPLELALGFVIDEWARRRQAQVCQGARWWQRLRIKKEFERLSNESYSFAMNFFSRRQLGIEEVREIALIGE